MRHPIQQRVPRARGFTLVEVLVALVVGALLTSGLLALQRHGLNQAREADLLWMHLNTAQEALMGQDLPRLGETIGRQWRITVTPPASQESAPLIILTTRVSGQDLDWSWPAMQP